MIGGVDSRNWRWLGGLGQRLNALLLGVPVSVKVMGIALGVTLLLGSGMLWQIHRTWHLHLLGGLREEGGRAAAQVLNHCVRLSRSGTTNSLAEELNHALGESPDDFVYLSLEDRGGTVVAEARTSEKGGSRSRILEQVAVSEDGALRLRAGLRGDRVDQEVSWLTRRLARVTGVIGLAGLAAAWWLTRIFAQPIEELVNLTRAVKAGHYTAKAPVRANDEVGELARAFNEMTEAVAEKEAARQHLLRQVIRAGEEERKRIARELHDHTGQALTSQIAALSALENRSREEALRVRLAEIRRQAEQTLAEVHDLAVALRPSVLDDVGLKAAIGRHCRLFGERLGVKTIFTDLDLGDQRLPAEVELTVYRVVQEALTNGVRHGRAERLHVVLQRGRTGLLAVVWDNGQGFDSHDWQKRCAEGNHLGLLGIEERVTLVGGSFCVDSQPGKGTTVIADIPLPEAS